MYLSIRENCYFCPIWRKPERVDKFQKQNSVQEIL